MPKCDEEIAYNDCWIVVYILATCCTQSDFPQKARFFWAIRGILTCESSFIQYFTSFPNAYGIVVNAFWYKEIKWRTQGNGIDPLRSFLQLSCSPFFFSNFLLTPFYPQSNNTLALAAISVFVFPTGLSLCVCFSTRKHSLLTPPFNGVGRWQNDLDCGREGRGGYSSKHLVLGK